MKRLFISGVALVALNDKKDRNHKQAVQFVEGLFNQTVKVYTSVPELVSAVEQIEERVGRKKATRCLELLAVDGGVTVLQLSSELLPTSLDLSGVSRSISYREFTFVKAMYAHGIKDVLHFNRAVQELKVMVWPRS